MKNGNRNATQISENQHLHIRPETLGLGTVQSKTRRLQVSIRILVQVNQVRQRKDKEGNLMSAQQILLHLLGNKCSLCNSTEKLVLHHIDRNRENNNLKNIILMCKLCHQKTHGFRDEQGNPLVKAVKIGNSIRMTIPKQIAEYLKINEGDTLEVTCQNSEITVKKKLVKKKEI